MKITAAVLLLFNGIGAMYGGLNLVASPDGNSMGLSLHLLAYTPFDNFLIPGIILLIANGWLSVFAVSAIFSGYKKWGELTLLQGTILTGWIFMQIILIRTVNILHAAFALAGMALMIIGYFEKAHLRKDSLILRQKRRLERMDH